MTRTDAGKVVLAVPIPPSPNEAPPPQHGGARTAWKNQIREDTFRSALEQCRPLAEPPQRVEVHSLFRFPDRRYFRDEDNLKSSLKYVLDALKRPEPGGNDPLTYRFGVATEKGWIEDDAPPECRIREPQQRVAEPGEPTDLVLNIVPQEQEEDGCGCG